MKKTVSSFMLVLVGMVVGVLGSYVNNVQAEAEGDHWICQSAAIYSFAQDARQAEWSNELQTWVVLETHDPANPADDEWLQWTGDAIEMGIMYANPDLKENGPAYVDYLDQTNGLLWRFAFKDLIATDVGGRYGNHHSCEQGPVVYKLAKSG
jgi:hypothetical protein